MIFPFNEPKPLDVPRPPTVDSRDTVWSACPMRMVGRQALRSDGHGPLPSMRGSIAVVNLTGVMVKGAPMWGDEVSTTETAAMVEHMSTDPSVSAIVLNIDSPGGMAAGTEQLAKAVREATERKTVVALCDGMCSSAAYWVASQCTHVYAADTTTLVGSIGTYLGCYDTSEAMANAGVKPILISSGGTKGVASFPGVEIDDETKANLQKVVDATQAVFSSAVVSGRNLTRGQVAHLADGRIHLATDAKGLGLIDDVKSFKDVVGNLLSTMDEEASPGLRSATREELARCVERMRAHADKNEAPKPKPKRKTAPSVGLGLQPLGIHSTRPPGASTAASDLVSWWNEEVQARVADGMTRREATRAVAHELPELREAYVAACNAKTKR